MRDAALMALAERQFGLVEITQARQAGVDDDAVRRRVASGRLVRAHPAVYRVAGVPITAEQRLMAACLAAGPDAAVSHRAGAHLWDIADGFGELVEIASPRPRWPRLDHVIVHRSTDLRPEHVTVRHGVPVTKPSRVLVDLGAVVPWTVVADALERTLVKRLLTPRAADAILDDVGRKGRSGAGVLRRVLDQRALGHGIPDGLLEPRMASLLRWAQLPPAEFQFKVLVGRRELGRVDFAWPDRLLVVEVDGFETHGTPQAFAADLVRQNELVSAGWTVLRFTWRQVVTRRAEVAAVLRPFLSR